MSFSLTLLHTCPPAVPGSMSAYASLVNAALETQPCEDLVLRHCFVHAPDTGASMWRHHLWRLRHARRTLERAPADLYHLLDGSMAAFVPRAVRARTVVTVHDVIPMLQARRELPGRPSRPARWLMQRSLAALSEMAGIAADSTNTSNDLRRLAGTLPECRVIPLAVRSFPAEAAGGRTYTPPSRYVLHVGNNARYKNREGVLDVFGHLQDLTDLELVMAGPPPTDALRRLAAPFGSRVRFLVDVTDGELAVLYRHAALLLFPSLYEGFGMPVQEAMAAGCPVVCSDTGSLPEVAGGAALTAPADDAAALAAHCRNLLEQEALRSTLRRKGLERAATFTMNRMGAQLLAWYRRSKC